MFNRDSKHFVFLKILSFVLIFVLTISVFSLTAFAGEYTDTNKSKYHLANWYGLDELPYGENSGVVYLKFHNGSKWIDLTICFNKCTPMAQYVGSLDSPSNYENNVIIKDFACSHLWGLKSGAKVSLGNSFYFSCVSDSPVLYTFGNTGENWKELKWSYVSTPVYRDFETVDGQLGTLPSYKTCYVYLDVPLSTIGFHMQTDARWYCYSNQLMVNNLSGNYSKDNIDLIAITYNVPRDSNYSGTDSYNTVKTDIAEYAYACYPSSECLRDWQLWDLENKNFKKISDSLSMLDNLYFSLGGIEGAIYDQNEKLDQMNETLNQIMHPEDYPSGGLLNDKSYSDQIDGVIGDINTDTSASQYITSLSASFIVIRGIWDKIVNTFGFAPVIGLLLFLAFVAYLLGRALKGRSE